MKIQPEESYGPSISAKSFAECKCSVKKEFLKELWISNVEKAKKGINKAEDRSLWKKNAQRHLAKTMSV